MGRVRTPIIGGPRPSPQHRRAHPDYTLNCEEPVKQRRRRESAAVWPASMPDRGSTPDTLPRWSPRHRSVAVSQPRTRRGRVLIRVASSWSWPAGRALRSAPLARYCRQQPVAVLVAAAARGSWGRRRRPGARGRWPPARARPSPGPCPTSATAVVPASLSFRPLPDPGLTIGYGWEAALDRSCRCSSSTGSPPTCGKRSAYETAKKWPASAAVSCIPTIVGCFTNPGWGSGARRC
jgi:hypothetical protein